MMLGWSNFFKIETSLIKLSGFLSKILGIILTALYECGGLIILAL